MRRASLPLSALLVLAAAATLAAAVRIAVIPLPPQTFSFANDVNDRGEIVGIHSNGSAVRAFVVTKKGAGVFSFPGSSFTSATGLNDAGEIVGIHATDDGMRGFFRSRTGRFSTISVPGAAETTPEDINRRRQVVGHFTQLQANGDPLVRGFLLDARGLRVLDNPLGGFYTLPQAMNDSGTIVGWFGGPEGDDPRHGFVLRGSRWTAVNYPGANQTYLTGVASNGIIVGYAVLFGQDPPEVGFVYHKGTFRKLPPAFQPYGVNRAGKIVGVLAAPIARAAETCASSRGKGKCR